MDSTIFQFYLFCFPSSVPSFYYDSCILSSFSFLFSIYCNIGIIQRIFLCEVVVVGAVSQYTCETD